MNVSLREVAVVRPALIICIVMMHSFAPFAGSWPSFEGYRDIVTYGWISKWMFGFSMELFVFLSGYVLAYQTNEHNRRLSYGTFCLNKFKRLVIPSIVFSLLYIFLFARNDFNVISVLSGYAHLWFLPMLFWCMVLGYPILRGRVAKGVVFPILLIVSLFSPYFHLPLRICEALYYLVFFVFGAYCLANKEWLKNIRSVWVILLALVCICLFLIKSSVAESIVTSAEVPLIRRVCVTVFKQCIRILFALSGIVVVMSVVLKSLSRIPSFSNERLLQIANSICFGVYIVHQFVLQYIYYHSDIPSACGSVMIPWVSFFLTMMVSICLLYLYLRCKGKLSEIRCS